MSKLPAIPMKILILCSCLVAAASAATLDFSAPIEKVGADFKFTEGPLWVAATSQLLFSDIPANRMVELWEQQKPLVGLK